MVGIFSPTLVVHGHAYHTDVMREIFVPPHGATSGTVTYKVGQAVIALTATGQYAYGGFRVPPDYLTGAGSTLAKLYLCWMSDTVNGTHVINTALQAGADDETYNTHTDTDVDRTIAVAAGDRYGCDDTGLDLSALAIGDMVGVKVDRDANTTQNLNVIGWGLVYLARE